MMLFTHENVFQNHYKDIVARVLNIVELLKIIVDGCRFEIVLFFLLSWLMADMAVELADTYFFDNC